jgi:hypothetical protein
VKVQLLLEDGRPLNFIDEDTFLIVGTGETVSRKR